MSPGGSFKIKPIGRSEHARDLWVPERSRGNPCLFGRNHRQLGNAGLFNRGHKLGHFAVAHPVVGLQLHAHIRVFRLGILQADFQQVRLNFVLVEARSYS